MFPVWNAWKIGWRLRYPKLEFYLQSLTDPLLDDLIAEETTPVFPVTNVSKNDWKHRGQDHVKKGKDQHSRSHDD